MWLMIDDARDLNVDVIARTAKAGKVLLHDHEWEVLLLDHDLGIDETGHDVLKYALKKKCLPKQVQLITMNLVGLKAMEATLVDAGYVKRDNTFKIK